MFLWMKYNNITDDRRIRSALNTIRYCIDNDCSVILASHFGRPKGGFEEEFSLVPIAKDYILFKTKRLKWLQELFVMKLYRWQKNYKLVKFFLENMRFELGETKK